MKIEHVTLDEIELLILGLRAIYIHELEQTRKWLHDELEKERRFSNSWPVN